MSQGPMIPPRAPAAPAAPASASPPTGPVRVDILSGEVSINGASYTPGQTAEIVSGRVSANAEGRARIVFADGSVIHVRPNMLVVVFKPASQPQREQQRAHMHTGALVDRIDELAGLPPTKPPPPRKL